MAFFLIFFFIFTIPINKLIGKIKNIKFLPIIFITSFFGLFQMILSPLSTFKLLNYSTYSLFVWFIFGIFILSYIFMCALIFYKNKSFFNRNIIKRESIEFIPVFISLLFGIIFLPFISSYFMDVTAYMNISSFFQNNFYSISGTNNDLSVTYSNVSQYFVYSSFIDYHQLYILLNPMIIIIICNLVIFSYFSKKITITKIFYNTILLLSMTGICLAWSYISTGGNLIMQSLFLVIMFMFVSNKNYFATITSMLFFQFFSSTGSLLTIVSFSSILLYILLFDKRRIFIIYLLSVLIIIQSPLNVFINFNFLGKYSKISLASLQIIIPFISLILLLFLNKYLSKKKNLEKTFIKESILKTKSFNYSFFVISFISIIILFIYLLFLNKSPHFNHYQSIAFFIISICILLFSIITFAYKNKTNDSINFLMISIIVSLFFFLIYGLIPSLSTNASIWRIIYFIPIMGSSPDIFVFTIIILFKLKDNIKNNNYSISTIHLIKIKERYLNISIVSRITLIISMIFASSSVLFIGNTFGVINEISISQNIYKNIIFFSKKDIKILNSLNIQKETKIFSNTRSMTIIGNGNDVSGQITEKINTINSYTSPWVISTYGIIGGIEMVFNKVTTVDEIKKVFDNIFMTENKTFADYYIMNNNENFIFNSWDKKLFSKIIQGEDITIFKI